MSRIINLRFGATYVLGWLPSEHEVAHVCSVGVSKKESLRSSPHFRVLLDGFANGGSVDDRQNLVEVHESEVVEEDLALKLSSDLTALREGSPDSVTRGIRGRCTCSIVSLTGTEVGSAPPTSDLPEGPLTPKLELLVRPVTLHFQVVDLIRQQR